MNHLRHGKHYGFCKHSKNAGSLILSECSYSPGMEIPKHSHENPYLILTLNGGQQERFDSRTREYAPSSLAFHPAGEVHSQVIHAEGMRCLHVDFGEDWTYRHHRIARLLEDPADFSPGAISALAHRIYREFRLMDDVSPISIEGLVLELLAEASRTNRPRGNERQPRWLERAREIIHEEYTSAISLANVAESTGIHPVHLARTFRREFRCSVGDYIRRLRIEHACELLRKDPSSLAEIAQRLGFADQAHFTRSFKRIMGLTPVQFKKLAVANGSRPMSTLVG